MQLTTDTVPVDERAETIREAIWRSVARLEIEHRRPDDIRVAACITDLGAVRLCELSTTPVTTRRTRALTRDYAPPSVFLQLQLSGTALVEQAGRQTVLVPGQFAVIDTRMPYTVTHERCGRRLHVQVPLAALALPDRAVRELLGVGLGRDRPLSRLVIPYLRRLAFEARSGSMPPAPDRTDASSSGEPGARSPEPPEPAGQATLLLVRALVAAQAAGGPNAREARSVVVPDALEARVLEYVRQRFTDPDLNARHIAAAHGISVRYLYKLLSRSGISLGSWIREQRLERCRVALQSAGAERDTIAAIAHRAGFGDLTNFSRSFKSAYGVSPREYRATMLPVTSAQS
ncbi:helix-turn-helix domain-containing protein [Intrasporangium mesophilum]